MNKFLCPLCCSQNLTIIENISSNNINFLFSKLFSISADLKSNQIEYLACNNCTLRFFLPIETGSEIFYESLQKFDWYYMSDKWEYAYASKFLRNQDMVLEIGAGKAAFAQVIGINRYIGLEFNRKALERASETGVSLIQQSVESHAAEGNTYDAVVSFQVLEHISAPADFIRGCIQCLKPEGILIISVPAHDGFLGTAINCILDMPPHHVSHWSGDTLEKTATLFGLELVAIEYEPIAEYHKEWVRKIILENKIRRLFGLKHLLLDISYLAKLLSRIASILARIFPVSINDTKGHTVTAVYKKRHE